MAKNKEENIWLKKVLLAVNDFIDDDPRGARSILACAVSRITNTPKSPTVNKTKKRPKNKRAGLRNQSYKSKV